MLGTPTEGRCCISPGDPAGRGTYSIAVRTGQSLVDQNLLDKPAHLLRALQDPHHLFRLHVALGDFAEASRVALAIVGQAQECGLLPQGSLPNAPARSLSLFG